MPLAATPPIVTSAPFWKFRPPIDTGLGTFAGPDVGAMDVTEGPGTAKHAENSEVSPAGSVAVAVTHDPSAEVGSVTMNAASPPTSVIESAVPRNLGPGPEPDASQTIVEKNSR